MNHLIQEKLISSKQHGFVNGNGRSTVTQLLKYLDIAEGKVVGTIYFAKAFDTVSHRRLLQKLESYGIKNETLALDTIRSALTDRHQVVKVNGAKSKKRKALSGVPRETFLIPYCAVHQ